MANRRPIKDPFQYLLVEPKGKAAFSEWLALSDVVPFLTAEAHQSEILLYLGASHAYVHGVLVPTADTAAATPEDLVEWNNNTSDTWSFTTSYQGGSSRVYVSAPLDHAGKLQRHGEQLVFSRFFERRHGGDKHYFEISQRLVHVLGIHYVEERDAYCRVGRLGDLEDVVRIVELPRARGDSHGDAVLCERKALEEYMTATKTILYRMFDFTRYKSGDFGGWPDIDRESGAEGDVVFRHGVAPGIASYIRGVQLIRSPLAIADLVKRFGSDEDERQYASFTVHDWRHQRDVEISSQPGATADYFVKSDLPYELSPAFFRPEVLLKYKGDTEKYTIRDRSITCHGAWYLKSFDINEAGQVHAYLVDLRGLPYEEQLHWKAYNEPRKGGISKRAFAADFEGRWHLDYDPLNSLKTALREAADKCYPFWRARPRGLFDSVHVPVTTSLDEWADALLRLDQLVIEGFESKWLTERATTLGRPPGGALGSLGRVELCLVGSGCDEERAREIMAPLRELHNLRTKFKGHASGSDAAALRKSLLRKHKSQGRHFEDLCARCDESIRTIWSLLAS